MKMLDCISNSIINRFKSGYYPTWKLEFIDIEESKISDSSIKYIAKQVKEVYRFGEIIENDFLKGYWRLSFYGVNE